MSTATELAQLKERLDNHIKLVQEWREEDRADRKLAAAERSEMLLNQQSLLNDMAKVKPLAYSFDKARDKFAGGLLVLGFVGAIAGSVYALFKDFLIDRFGF